MRRGDNVLRPRIFERVSLALLLAALAVLLSVGVSAGAGTGPPVNVTEPVINGIAKDEVTLKAARGTWTGAATITYAYQWKRCDTSGASCTNIASATKASYKVAHADVGHTLRVTVTATNGAGSSSATSNQTATVVPSAPAKKTFPKISGSAEDGQLLTVSNGGWKGTTPLTFTYVWEVCSAKKTNCSVVSGATAGGYRPVTSQIGRYLRAIVTATNTVGTASMTSTLTKKITAGPPVNVALPTISGTLQESGTLTATTGTWMGSGPFTYTYQWQRCNLGGGGCESIAGATGSTYTVAAADVASKLDVVVTASNALGSASATSAETQPVAAVLPVNTLLPTITGLSQDGQILSIATGVWEGTAPIVYSYQWQLCNALGVVCENISGATGPSLKLVASEIGSTLAVVVTATNTAGSSSVTTPISSLIAGLLPINTVLPTISGLLQDGQLLSVATGGWSGSEPITYAYQWQLCNALGEVCKDITAATGSSLKLDPADVGSTLAVVVTATNAAGSSSATSSVTSLIGAILPKSTSLPSISGLLEDGQLLSAVTGSWEGTAPITYSYQWQLCNALGAACEDISGATGSGLKLSPADVGSTLALVVTATNAAGSSSATSSVTSLIAALLPKNTALPNVTGTLIDGSSLTSSTGTWSGTSPTYSYQWQLCNSAGGSCSNISGAVGSALSLVAADVGSTVRMVVTATNSAGSTSATSEPSGLIAALLPSNTGPPSITGTLEDGQLLSAATGAWSGTNPTYFYQWQLCNNQGEACSNISGATASALSLISADVGSTLRVVVTATNSAGSTSANSSATKPILAILPKNTELPSISGVLKLEKPLSATTGNWSGTAPITYAYQWQLCNALKEVKTCANISEATSSTFLLKLLDVGNTLRIGVTATNARGSVQAFSAITGLIEGLLLAPASGSSGTPVTLTGSGVSAATAVSFGSAEVSEVEVNSPSEITVQAPAGTGKVPVTVTVPEGTTAANPKDMFTYR